MESEESSEEYYDSECDRELDEIQEDYKKKNFPELQETEEIKNKLENYKKIDEKIGKPLFPTRFDSLVYRETMKYLDATDISGALMDTIAYLYENPCPLSEAQKIMQLVFPSSMESDTAKTANPTDVIHETDISQKRIYDLQEEIRKHFFNLMRMLHSRKVHSPFAMEPAFDSYHLLEAFSIYSRPEDYPDFPEELKPKKYVPCSNDKLPYLVEPGSTLLEEDVEWSPWETSDIKMRESLKFNDLEDGIPKELNTFFDEKKLRFPILHHEDELDTSLL